MTATISAAERYADAASNGIQNDAMHAGALVKGWATKLFRLKYANDPSLYNECLIEFKRISTNYGRRNAWTDELQVRRTAKRVFDYWLVDICPSCQGRGYKTIPGTPTLSDEPCDSCHGEKTREIDGIGERLAQAHILLGYLKETERAGGAAIMRFLRKEMDF